MPEKTMWMVRAGEGAYAIDDFRNKKLVAIGWSDGAIDWTKCSDRDAIQKKIAEQSPEHTDTQNLVAASQIERFLRELKVGDRIITYDPSKRRYLVGTIKGLPQHDPQLVDGLATYRRVLWENEEIKRDELSDTTRNSLGAISTLFKVPESAAQEMEAQLVDAPITVDVAGEKNPIKKTEFRRAQRMNDLKTCFKRVDYDLSGLLHYIDIGDIGLPDIQRPFVWSDQRGQTPLKEATFQRVN